MAAAETLDLAWLVWDAGAPLPVVFASDSRTLFCFHQPFDDATGIGKVVVAEFTHCTSVRFGSPNDEALHGHLLYGHGLQFYAAHTVTDSPWLEELRAIERHHRRAPEHPFADSKHFLLAFHDSTLEAIASAVNLVNMHDGMPDALAHMASRLQ